VPNKSGQRTHPRKFKKVAGGKRVSWRALPYPEVSGFRKTRMIAAFIAELPWLPYNERVDIDWSGTPAQKFVTEFSAWSRHVCSNRGNLMDGGAITRLKRAAGGA
jgi:hypothetical protein